MADNSTLVKDTNHYIVEGWMLTRLGLKGLGLQVFAIIHGFSQGNQGCFYGSIQYLMDFTGSSKQGIVNVLNELQLRGLIRKRNVGYNKPIYNTIVPEFNIENTSKDDGQLSRPSMVHSVDHMVHSVDHDGTLSRPNNKDIININTKVRQTREKPADCLPKKPTLEEVKKYVEEHKLKIDPVKFYEKNEERGWVTKTGKPIKRWKSILWSWADREQTNKPIADGVIKRNDYDFDNLEKQIAENL